MSGLYGSFGRMTETVRCVMDGCKTQIPIPRPSVGMEPGLSEYCLECIAEIEKRKAVIREEVRLYRGALNGPKARADHHPRDESKYHPQVYRGPFSHRHIIRSAPKAS